MSTIAETGVLIIGGGILGTAVARELSRYKVDSILVEKKPDIGWDSTKANLTIVCQGADCLEFRKEYQRSKYVWESIPMMEPLCRELDVPFKRIGELGIMKNNADLAKFQKKKSRAEQWVPNIANHQFIDRDTLRQWEPNVTKEAIGALYDPTIAITDPVRLAMALAENASQNGTRLMMETEVLDITPKVEAFEVQTNQGVIKARFIVNAAGEYVDRVARMVNADDFIVFPFRGYVGILDKKLGGLVNHMVYAQPPEPGQINALVQTVHGNVFFGTPMKIAKRADHSVERDLAETAFQNAHDIVPEISQRDIINSFAGFVMFRNVEVGWHECVVRASDTVPGFINLSIGYPGVSASPAAAKEVIRLLSQEGLALVEKEDFNPYRKAIVDFSELPDEEKQRLVKENPQYGHVVCRCETVTEGEIVEAIKRGASTLDGVKFRTRPGMGRCQGGFCTPRVSKILSRELGVPEEQVTKKGDNSRNLLFRSKELIKERDGFKG
ncbi:MAG: NAD(P)/FAD-dependent oxidoreductase [Dehalococcoidia bacterium]